MFGLSIFYHWHVILGQELAKYVHPPDLFVERLDRSTLEAVITELLEKNEMKPEWLCQAD
jgi:hypothetical protein